MELIDEMKNYLDLCEQSIKSLKRTGHARAETERDYKVLLRQECLKLRDSGTAIGMIELTCYGIPSVAEARFNRDVADTNYTANLEAINFYKLKCRLLDNQINREYGMAGKGNF